MAKSEQRCSPVLHLLWKGFPITLLEQEANSAMSNGQNQHCRALHQDVLRDPFLSITCNATRYLVLRDCCAGHAPNWRVYEVKNHSKEEACSPPRVFKGTCTLSTYARGFLPSQDFEPSVMSAIFEPSESSIAVMDHLLSMIVSRRCDHISVDLHLARRFIYSPLR